MYSINIKISSGKMSYFVVATAFAVIAVVCSNGLTLDSYIEDKLNGFVKSFHSRKVSVLDRLVR